MREKIIILLLFYSGIGTQELFSQKINNTWFFGNQSGLNFNTIPPTPLVNQVILGDEPPYYTSSISDKDGILLFYTSGNKIWNALNKEMPQIANRWPWLPEDNVLPLICPYPGNDSLYYLFTVGKGDGNNHRKFLYLTINIKANNNLGGIVYPQPSTNINYFTVLASNASMMLAGTAHCNQRDSWIVTIADGVIKSFLVSSSETNQTPVISTLAIQQSMLENGYSNMKFSANSEKLVIPVVSKNEILIYDFNNQTGVFSNPLLLHLPTKELLEDVELSASGNKLYYGSYENQIDGIDYTGVELHNIYQLNIEAGSASSIENSRYTMNAYPDRGGCPRSCYIIKRTLQLGPDGKIYISLRDLGNIPLDKSINVIEYPDKNKTEAFYHNDYITLKNVYKFINVSYIRSGSFSTKENGIQTRKKICLGLPTEFSLLYTKIDSVKWDFGDPESGTGNYSVAFAPSHNYITIGVYTVKAIIYKSCTVDTAITQISIDPDPIVRIPSFIKDTIICSGNVLKIDAVTKSATAYLWGDGLIYSYRVIKESGNFLVRAYNACSIDQKSFTVKFEECTCDVYIPSAFTPNHDGLNDDFKPITGCFAKDYTFIVFNSYGNIIFSTSELNKGWNGQYKNMEMQSGVFVWMLQYRNPNNNEIIKKEGTVTLIR